MSLTIHSASGLEETASAKVLASTAPGLQGYFTDFVSEPMPLLIVAANDEMRLLGSAMVSRLPNFLGLQTMYQVCIATAGEEEFGHHYVDEHGRLLMPTAGERARLREYVFTALLAAVYQRLEGDDITAFLSHCETEFLQVLQEFEIDFTLIDPETQTFRPKALGICQLPLQKQALRQVSLSVSQFAQMKW